MTHCVREGAVRVTCCSLLPRLCFRVGSRSQATRREIREYRNKMQTCEQTGRTRSTGHGESRKENSARGEHRMSECRHEARRRSHTKSTAVNGSEIVSDVRSRRPRLGVRTKGSWRCQSRWSKRVRAAPMCAFGAQRRDGNA